MAHPSTVYSSKILKAGSILSETKTLLSLWDEEASDLVNIERAQRENLFGKSSRSRVRDVLAIIRQRYLAEEAVRRALVVLVKGKFPGTSLDRILYFHTARADPLLYDVVIEYLNEQLAKGITEIDVAEFQKTLKRWVIEEKTCAPWSDSTIERIARGLLSTLRDFGVLRGAVKKWIAPTLLPIEAFAYLAFYFKQHQPSGVKLAELPDWKLFFLPREGVERCFFEAHQLNLLEYHAAGSVTRLTFPAATLEEYAHVLVTRPHRTP
jgi:hypothetical protein